MNLEKLWQRFGLSIFITLAFSFVILDMWLAHPHLYEVTMYILIVTLLIGFIQKRYQETPRTLSIPNLQLLPTKNYAAQFNLSDILLREFDYVKETAAQAMNDREIIVKYFLLFTGAILLGMWFMLREEGGARFAYRFESLIAVSLLFNAVGWISFMQVVRLRQAWCESARAMNHLKQFFVKHCEYPPDIAKRAFRWNIESIPLAAKKMTVFYFSALLISILSSAAIALASTILPNVELLRKSDIVHQNLGLPLIYPLIGFGLGLYHLFFQMSMYSALLEERLLSTEDDLYQEFQKSREASVETKELREQFQAHMEYEELLDRKRRLNFGNFVIEQPELLKAYSSAILEAAKHDPNGMGSIAEDDVLAGRFTIPDDIRIKDREKENVYLVAAVENLLRDEIALREPAHEGLHLVFPSAFTHEHPDLSEPTGKAVIFKCMPKVSLLHVYATLAVRLSYSGLFKKKEIWKNAVMYTAKVGGTYGILLREIENGGGELTLFFDGEASEETRFHFEDYVLAHLQDRALQGSIDRQRIFVCSQCTTPVTDLQVDRRRARGFNWIECNVCGERVSLLDRQERITGITVSRVPEMHRAADERREREAAAATLQGKIATGDFDVFLAHNNQDKPQVEAVAEKLKQRGLYPWLDKEQILPGEWFQEVIQQAIPKVKSAAIFIGPKGLGKWQVLELRSFISRCVEAGIPVIPVLLPGVEDIPQELIFLKQLHWVRFAEDIDDPEALDELESGILRKRYSKN
ncbi:toll/interleukin-1 receptor domain-containing protein [candidate division KSB1 bacterium]|nr:toll/interleukin-1 receptor domain-containing protein [candidate division KSB1 bacterium]